jgi:AraC family transcriptional regulator
MHEYGKGHIDCRMVTGELIASSVVDTSLMRVETLRRKSATPVDWHFQQPRLALFWFQSGVDRMRLRLDGKVVHTKVSPDGVLTLVPACIELQGEFIIKPYCDYSVVFIDDALFQRYAFRFDKPLLAFKHRVLEQGIAMLCHQAAFADSAFELFAEGWALQALAHIVRASDQLLHPQRVRGGLTAVGLQRVKDFIHANFGTSLSVSTLAQIAGVSTRHFLRAFQESTGQTPLSFVQSVRVDMARQLLMDSRNSITEVALECGFSHGQHFSDRFKGATGLTPSAFRKAHRY